MVRKPLSLSVSAKWQCALWGYTTHVKTNALHNNCTASKFSFFKHTNGSTQPGTLLHTTYSTHTAPSSQPTISTDEQEPVNHRGRPVGTFLSTFKIPPRYLEKAGLFALPLRATSLCHWILKSKSLKNLQDHFGDDWFSKCNYWLA